MLLSFIGVAIAAALTPGPDTAVIVRHAATGRAAGLAVVAGVVCGLLAHATFAVVGISSILLTSATLFGIVKLAGAAYLLVLGVAALRSAWRRDQSPQPAGEPAGEHRRRPAFRQGLLTNLLNPKTSVFFITLLPQFMTPGTASPSRTLVLSLIVVATASAWYVALALGVSRLGSVLRAPSVRRTLDAVTGCVLVGLAARLALARR